MHVTSSRGTYDWPISSARSGFYTPGGSFAPTHLERMHYSKKYHMSPMPYSIFFRGGFAIHGTYAVGELGRPASHGCVRLSPGHAAMLYGMVQSEGARIAISGTPPASRPFRRDDEARRRVPGRIAAHRFDRFAAAPVTHLHPRRYARAPYTPRVYRGAPYGYEAYSYPYGARPAESYTQSYVYTPPQPMRAYPYYGQ
jgi:hypothetical protein